MDELLTLFVVASLIIIRALTTRLHNTRFQSKENQQGSGILTRLKGETIIAEEDLFPEKLGKGNLDRKIWSIKSKEHIKMGEIVVVEKIEGGVLWVKRPII